MEKLPQMKNIFRSPKKTKKTKQNKKQIKINKK